MRFRGIWAAIGLVALGSPAWSQATGENEADVPAETAPVEVMVFGTYHFANPGRDLANVDVDDVLAPHRQAEIEALVDAIAAWRPTRILIETEAGAPNFEVAGYREFTPAMLGERRNEIVQIGYRLAHRLGHEAVYGFDERGGEGEPDYFPFDAVQSYAAAHGQREIVDGLLAYIQAEVAAMSDFQRDHSIPENLMSSNDSAANRAGHSSFYYGMLAIGDGETQPGAELNAYWYMRNAKMFAKIGLIAEPGDRIFVLVGAGHRYWLSHFAENAPGYVAVDPMPYLEAAAAAVSR
ncbi:DUF5694 domain-containing protein [Parasphingopyxis marina]|uniref:Uncharacterized protein n=1 Tax=Parasphingopyxis marina TaxID=2761622 RepID=A0A842HWM3_9SPHN|nr:DUF5694 domain-containing protein [Parasphingopyxis marina]MBC2777516.1 hypothetical protein [Parasphingopyxis marina]